MDRLSVLFIVISLLFSTGCAPTGGFNRNYRSIEQLQLVHTIGLDLQEGQVLLSASAGEASGGEESKGPGITRLTATGENITDAIARLQHFAGKEELYFAHTRYVLVGEDYAKQGLEQLIDYLEHSPQLRSDLPLFVVRGSTAREVVTKAGDDSSSVFDLMESVIRSCADDGTGYPFTCGDMAIFNAQQGSALVCALETLPTKQANHQAEDEAVTPTPAGYAIIKAGKLVGYLTKDAARGINLLLGQWGTETITLESDGTPTSLQFREAKVTLQPKFGKSGGLTELLVVLEVHAEGEQSRLPKPEDLEAEIRGWTDEIFQAMRATGTDFLGFGPKIALKHPRWSGDLTDNIATLPMKAEVHCEIFAEE